MPDISVIIPTHNRARMLPETVASAQQASASVEVIVVDDASTDDTPIVCQHLRGIRYLRLERNSGSAAARNAGIGMCTSEYVAFLDDDDLRLIGSLDAQLRVLKANPDAAFVYGRVLLGDARFSLPTGQIVPDVCPTGDVFWQLLEMNFIQIPSVLARKRCIEAVGMFNAQLRHMEDYDLWVRLAETYKVVATEEPVALYRMANETSNQMTSDLARHNTRRKEVLNSLLNLPRAQSATQSKRRTVRSRHYGVIYTALVGEAARVLMKGDRARAQSYLLAAARLRPLHVKAHVSLFWVLMRHLLEKAGHALPRE